MKLDQKTLQVLKNFSFINPSMLFREGNLVSTVSPTKSVFARATIDQSFPKEFAIYDLSRLIGVLSLFNTPEIEFRDQDLRIAEGEKELEYRYASASTIIVPPEKDLSDLFSRPYVNFKITAEMLSEIQRGLNVLGMPEISILGDGKFIYLQAFDSKNTSSDSFKLKINETDKTFLAVFKAEHLKLIVQDYDVSIIEKGLSMFRGSSVVNVDYFVTLEAKTSKFD